MKMLLKIVATLCVTLAVVHLTVSIPLANKNELEKSFVEFLKQDKEFHNLISSGRNVEGLRHVRSAEDDAAFDESEMGVDQNQPGFFDRAAKFVMEVLQRFLKWINSDN